MKIRLLSVLPPLVGVLACSGADDQAKELAVLQFLVASNGAGHFERVSTYCVGISEAQPVSPQLMAGLAPFAQRVLDADACRYSERHSRIVTGDDERPAIRLYARSPGTHELERFSQSELYGLDLERASLVMAGFYEGDLSSADFICWVTEERPPKVLTCDAWRIA
jgi:hypothetical protein